jgi:hypothetical protein
MIICWRQQTSQLIAPPSTARPWRVVLEGRAVLASGIASGSEEGTCGEEHGDWGGAQLRQAVTEVLQRCRRGAAEVLQRCCRGAAEVLQRCCRGAAEVLQRCCRGVAEVLQRCCRGVAEVLQRCCRGCRGCRGPCFAIATRYTITSFNSGYARNENPMTHAIDNTPIDCDLPMNSGFYGKFQIV